MKRQPIKSSSIVSAGFENGVLELEFTSTAIYRFSGVPEEVWKAFLATDSKGGYFVARIRDRFKFECVYRPPRKEKTNGSVEKEEEATHRKPGAKPQKEKARRIS